MRIYLSGPITGCEDTAKSRFAFAKLSAALRIAEESRNSDENGQNAESVKPEIINPFAVTTVATADLDRSKVTHDEYMIMTMALLSICDTIYMMTGWEHSKGCMQEYKYAKANGFKIFYQ